MWTPLRETLKFHWGDKEKGDLFSFTIKCEDAYGAPLEEAIIEVDEDFPTWCRIKKHMVPKRARNMNYVYIFRLKKKKKQKKWF